MAEEYLDILNERGEKTGEKRSYAEAHRKGLWHKSVHVWFLNSNKQLRLQKRSKNKVAYPKHWDISVSGHVSAGQTSLEAAKRETQEEIGLVLPDSAFEYLFTLEERVALNDGTYVSNEFQDVFLVRCDVSVSELTTSADEVEAVRWMSISDFETLMGGTGEPVVPHKEEYKRLLEYVKIQ